MQLSRKNLGNISKRPGLTVPDAAMPDLPEKVLQFGTGVLLRGLPDYFIDEANRQGIFNGRVVIVKSTDSDSSAFDRQDGLYTICIRGTENGRTIEKDIINASVSRVLGAATEWKKILACAHQPGLGIIISNTTEVGIELVEDDIKAEPPVSFPGKLLAFLYERFRAFNGSAESGMVIVPTELITDNGTRLEGIVLEHAHRNNLESRFIEWLENHNTFCNSLVDRIVPGKPAGEALDKIQTALGYTDDLLTMSEVFRLWAIQGDDSIREKLSFARVDDGVVIAPDITLFKELKLRLLNGTHSFNCGLAFLAGFDLTRQAITDETYGDFTRKLMHDEIAGSIPFEIPADTKRDFANAVFERFCNPFIDHSWLSISVQYTSKMNMRNVPLLLRHYEQQQFPPLHMATGFAGYLLFMKAVRVENNRYFGERNGIPYEIKDNSAEYFYQLWKSNSPADLAATVLSNTSLWDADLSRLPGFLACVQEQLLDLVTQGVLATISQIETKKVTA
jgi:tagaturonate reductase